jgi:hypothetical protein
LGAPGLKNPEASKFFGGQFWVTWDICAEHSFLSSARSSSMAKGRSPASHEGLGREALQQLFTCIEASAPPWIVVVGPIIVGPTIVAVVVVVIRSIVGPVIATVGVTIAAMPDFLDRSSTKLA